MSKIRPGYFSVEYHDAEMARIKSELRGMSAVYNMGTDKESLAERFGIESATIIKSQAEEIKNLKALLGDKK